MIKTSKAGSGAYGTVYNARDEEDSTEIAVKRNIIDADISFSGSIKELDLLNQLRGHPYIVKLISISFGSPFSTPNSPIIQKRDSHYKEDYMYFVFEKAEKNLHNIIYEKLIHVGYLKLSMVQILLAVEYMHSKGIIHRDIKPANLLWFVDECRTSVKLCDFGLSKVLTSQDISSPHVVTCWYRAPEICSHENYSFPSDIWSVGCVFYEMVAKAALLIGCKDNDRALLDKIVDKIPSDNNKKKWKDVLNLKKKSIEEFNKYPGNGATYDEFLDLLGGLLKINAKDRLTVTEALDHQFFNPYKNIIEWSRENFPPIPKTEQKLKIIECFERKRAVQYAYHFFNERGNLEWYKHRVLFQSIDLFDRYLEYCEESGDFKVPSINNGKYLTKNEINLRYKICLYMAIKCFTSLTVPISFEELVEEKLRNDKILIEAENFEQKMIRDVLKFKIYRETIYESSDKLKITLNDRKIRDILEAYGNFSSRDNITSLELLKEILGHE